MDTDGITQGHVLYDGYGKALTSTLSLTLSTALAGQGATPDPDTGLVYLGDGRWYDPVLGRPLQPNPVGGPPALPQALNRYAPTPWGAPGVAQGVNLTAIAGVSIDGLAQSTAIAASEINSIFVAFRDTSAQTALGYAAGRVIEATAWGHLAIITSQSTWYRTIGRTSLNLRTLFQRGAAQPQLGRTFRAYTTLGRVRTLGNGRYLAETGEVIDTARLLASAQVRFVPRFGPLTRNLLGGGAAFGISGVFQGVEDYFFEPYLTPVQRAGRITISGLGGIGTWMIGGATTEIAAGAGAGSWAGLIGIFVGATVTFVWIEWIQPAIFEATGLETGTDRNLAPLLN